ncbi:MAG: type II secretion system protein GspJ [Pseudomonadota bacterium]|nr:type II secretion system protein GspJ [Pseudomonadota bacterium]
MERKNKNLRSGFTLIEVLIAIIIMTVIAVISTNILQSSLSSREFTNQSLEKIKKINLASNLVRRDFRQSVNVPMKDLYGQPLKATFLSPEGSKRIIFTVLVNRYSEETSGVRRVEYLFNENSFIRRQYFAGNPYSSSDYSESVLFKDIDDVKISFSDGIKWVNSWPLDELTQRSIPRLIQIQLMQNNKSIEWIISPKNDHVYQQ